MIEHAYLTGEATGLPVWCADQAGPFQTVPHPGPSWRPEGEPACQPHEYLRNGTAKILTLFHPADGRVRIEGVTSCPNTVLHPWLKRELTAILAAMPKLPAQVLAKRASPEAWESWQDGLSIKPTLLSELPPLRMLLVLDNLAGHKTPEFVCWLFERGIMPLYTPVGGSWLNMAESIQRVLKRRALGGQHPHNGGRDHGVVRGGGAALEREPDAVRVGRKASSPAAAATRAAPSDGGSGACTRTPIRRGPDPSYGHIQRE